MVGEQGAEGINEREAIDVETASALIERSGLIVAHNARLLRPFVKRVLPGSTPLRVHPDHPALQSPPRGDLARRDRAYSHQNESVFGVGEWLSAKRGVAACWGYRCDWTLG